MAKETLRFDVSEHATSSVASLPQMLFVIPEIVASLFFCINILALGFDGELGCVCFVFTDSTYVDDLRGWMVRQAGVKGKTPANFHDHTSPGNFDAIPSKLSLTSNSIPQTSSLAFVKHITPCRIYNSHPRCASKTCAVAASAPWRAWDLPKPAAAAVAAAATTPCLLDLAPPATCPRILSGST